MNSDKPPFTVDANEEVAALIETLHRTEQRLEELTAGEVDTVADRDGRTLLLRHAQEYMRHNEAVKQAAILNALPANIAVLDTQGLIIAVNDAWRRFGHANALQGSGYEIGVNYLEVCDSAHGEDASEAQQAATGIRAVLKGEERHFSMEYPCHSPAEQRWFLMTVTPLADDSPKGVVVMHLNITERKQAELALKKNERRLTEALTIAKMGYWEYEYPTDEFVFNDEYYLLHGITAEEAGGYRMSSADFASRYVYPDDATMIGQHVRSAFETRDPDYFAKTETRILTADGKIVWVEVRMRIQKDLQGNTNRLVGVNQDITERKLAENALRESEARFQRAVAGANDGIWEWIPATGEDYLSPRWKHLLGYEDHELPNVQESFFNQIHPEDRALAEEAVRAHLEERKPFSVELRMRSKGGEYRWFSSRGQAEWDDQGRPLRMSGSISDITERKLAENALRESERRFSDMLGNVELISMMLDRDARITYCNEYLLHLTGWRREEVIGRNWFEVFVPPEIMYLKDEFFAALLANQPEAMHHENEILTRSGERRLILWNNSVLRSGAGDVIGTASIGEDITERKAAEKRVAYLNRVYAMQSGISTLIVRVHDSGELFTESCRIAVETGGFRMAMIGIVDRSTMQIVPMASAGKNEELLSAINSILSGELASNTMFARAIREKKIIVSNDSQSDPQVLFSKQYDEAGVRSIIILPLMVSDEAIGALALYATERNFFHEEELKLLTELVGDISFAMNYLKAQEALRSLNEELEDKVAIRTADLKQARLVADQANQAKSAFLATMSHEIRTPMNGVIGMVDVLQQSSLNSTQMEMTNIIHDSAFSLLSVINDILDFSKIEAGKLQIECVPMCVADVVEGVCELMDRMALKKGVELTLFTDPDIPAEVLGDPGRLRQILINLAHNAVKFSSGKQRSGQVSVRAILTERNTESVVLEFRVTDNGIGIDEKTFARLFLPFTQADASTTRNFGGTGLGLTISRQLTNMMNGEITVQSEPGKGSLFSVSLPFKLPPEPIDVARSGLLDGLSCLVLGYPDGMANDLATYLAYDNAVVERATDLATAQQWIASRSSGRSIVVIDTRVANPPLDDLRAIARANPESDTHFVVIGRGNRRGPREEDTNLVSVDGNVLPRRALVNAVAIAAGRAMVPDQEALLRDAKTALAGLPTEMVRRHGSLILIAEDNDINQSVIQHQLGILGYVAEFADDGREAYAMWYQGNYGLLLTDLHMPEMDGYDLTVAIRRAEVEGKRLPIIALTANALKSEEIRCKEVGMDDFLTKPVLLDRLQTMLEKWLPIPDLHEAADDAPELPASNCLAVLDKAVLPMLVGNNPTLIAEFFRDYQRSAHKAAKEIRDAIALGDWKTAGDGAHKLKSSSRSVGALALGDICARLEQAGNDVDSDAVLALAPEFENAMAAVLAATDQEEN